MRDLVFEWDKRKNRANVRKHGVDFQEARTVFFDDDALLRPDEPAEPGVEDQYIILGLSWHMRVLAVCHCYRRGEEVIRIISARRASRTELRQYENRRDR